MGIRSWQLLVIAAAVGLGVWSNASAQVRLLDVELVGQDDLQNMQTPLVAYDLEVSRYLEETQKLIEAGDTDQALRNLQALLAQTDALFVPVDKGLRYVSLRSVLNELIASLPPEAMSRYRLLYDPPARQLYEQALAAGDGALLKRVVTEYRHTTVGPKALEAMGHWAFDRGRNAAAAQHWRHAAEVADETAKPLLLGKAAVAFHLAGMTADADAATGALTEAHPQARAILAGRDQLVVDFVTRMRERPVEHAAATLLTDWPGLGALTGEARMAPADPPSLAEWTYRPDGKAAKGSLLIQDLISPDASEATPTVFFRLQGGHVSGRYQGYQGVVRFVLPSYVLPVVVGGRVIVRTEWAVVACDLRTGKVVWRYFMPIRYPMGKGSPGVVRRSYRGDPPMKYESDSGRYWLTAGGGLVFVVGELSGSSLRLGTNTVSVNQHGDAKQFGRLTALRAGNGTRVWTVPGPARRGPEITGVRFTSPPSYYNDRVYIAAVWSGAFHLFCLEARTGQLVWREPISQIPFLGETYGMNRDLYVDQMLMRASPPVVADGRVVVLTNAGVVAAYEADTGQPVWAYQYPSVVNSDRPYIHMGSHGQSMWPINPVLALGDRIVCLPGDSQTVLCLSAADGRRVWGRGRYELKHLTALDSQRVLLSGPGLAVLAAGDGRRLALLSAADLTGEDRANAGVYGRPAVTPDGVMLSADERIVLVDVDGKAITAQNVSSVDVPGPTTILGSLVSAGDRLIAANAAGVAVYVGFPTVRAEIEQQVSQASGAEAVRLRARRAAAAVRAGLLDEAAADLAECEHAMSDLAALPPEVAQTLHHTYVDVGQASTTPHAMLAMFEASDAYARSRQERAHSLLRQAKARALFDAAGALATIHQLVDRFGDEQIVDVPVGPQAVGRRVSAADARTSAGQYARDIFIPSLLQRHGREVYAAFDAQAKDAYDRARAAGDAEGLHAVARRWPNSVWADDALMAAAEIDYRRALTAPTEAETGRLIERARASLFRVARQADSPLALSAQLGRAALRAHQGNNVVAALIAEEAWRQARHRFGAEAGQVQVAFAGIEGTLTEAMSAALAGGAVAVESPVTPPQLQPPLVALYTIDTPQTLFLTDLDGQAIGADGGVFMRTAEELVRLAPGASSAETAVVWRSAEAGAQLRSTADEPGFRADLSPDERVLYVGGESVVAVDVQTGQTRWAAPSGRTGNWRLAAGPAGCLIARGDDVVYLDATDGSVRWSAPLAARDQANRGRYPATVYVDQRLAVVCDNGDRTIRVIDPATGRLLAEAFEGTRRVRATLTESGVLVVLIDETLMAFDPARLDRPLWRREVSGLTEGWFGRSERGQILVHYRLDDGDRVEMLNVTDGTPVLRIEPPWIRGQRPRVDTALAWRGGVYVLSRLQTPATGASGASSAGIFCQKIDPDSGELAWWLGLPGTAMPVMMADHLIVGQYLPENGSARIISLADGTNVKPFVGAAGVLNGVTTPPVVAGDRLVVLTTKGVTVYGPAD